MAIGLEAETYIWLGIVCCVYLTRITSRFYRRGLLVQHAGRRTFSVLRAVKNLTAEDWIMTVAFAFYIADCQVMLVTARQQSNLLPPHYLEEHTMSKEEIADRHFGSIMTVVVEQCQIQTVWLAKICVLSIWYNLTKIALEKRNRIVVGLGIYVIFTWALMETLYFAVWCRPFRNYFAVPTPNPKQCAAAWNHLILNAVCNLSSDIMLLIMTVSIAFERTITGVRKIAFTLLCLIGLFVIACAIANKTYSWKNPFGSEWTFWYIREASTAIIVANLPYIWSAVRMVFGTDDISYGSDGPSAPRHSSVAKRVDEESLEMKSANSPSKQRKLSKPSTWISPKEVNSSPSSTRPITRTESHEGILRKRQDTRYTITGLQEKEVMEDAENWHSGKSRRRLYASTASSDSAEYDVLETSAGLQEVLSSSRLPADIVASPTSRRSLTTSGPRPAWMTEMQNGGWDQSADIKLADVSGLSGKRDDGK